MTASFPRDDNMPAGLMEVCQVIPMKVVSTLGQEPTFCSVCTEPIAKDRILGHLCTIKKTTTTILNEF